MRRRLSAAVLWLLLAAYLAGIYVLSAGPRGGPAHVDKLLHLLAYAGLALVAWGAFRTITRNGFLAGVGAFLLATGYGALDEWHQSFVPGRASDVRDWLADTAGAAVVLGLLVMLGAIRRVLSKT
jgi:VanZ family protein